MLQTQIEYVTVPPGLVTESLVESDALTQSAPGFGDGVGLGDLDGVGDFDGVGDLDGVGVFDGVGDFDGVGLELVDGEVLFEGLGLPDGLVLLDGLGLLVGLGLLEGLELPVGVGLWTLAAAEGPASENMLARTTAVAADPHRLCSGTAESASTGAMTGPDSRNRPAPAATATCPARTTLTGTAALR